MESNLNASQSEAVCHVSGPALVLAGPGSGKTTVIARRIRHLVADCGIDPAGILVMTFSKAAAKEMEERYEDLAAPSSRSLETGACNAHPLFGTFHSVFLRILRESGGASFGGLITEEEKTALLRSQLEALGFDTAYEEDRIRDLKSELSRVKSSGTDPFLFRASSLPQEEFIRVYAAYRQALHQMHRLDFDDLQIACRDLLRKDPVLCRKWQQAFPYVLIDEFQDVSPVQYELSVLLAAPENNLFVVGDDDQSIYGFRGAKPAVMKEFLRTYPDARQVLLSINYRCSPEILSASQKLITRNAGRFPKKIQAFQKDHGPESFQIRSYPSAEAEYDALLREIRKEKEAGQDLSQTAVLFRSFGDASGFLARLKAQNIPVCTPKKPDSPADHFICRDILSYARIAAGTGACSDWLRILNRPLRYLSRDALHGNPEEPFAFRLRHFYRKSPGTLQKLTELERQFAFLKTQPPAAAVMYIRKAIGYETWVRDYAAKKNVDFRECEEIFEWLQEQAASFQSLSSWLKDSDSSAPCPSENTSHPPADGLRVLTMHASKGLEFDTVYLPDVNKGIVPHIRSAGNEALEEERRLFYVAMTRAKKKLVISFTGQLRGKHAEPSLFIKELSDGELRDKKRSCETHSS